MPWAEPAPAARAAPEAGGQLLAAVAAAAVRSATGEAPSVLG